MLQHTSVENNLRKGTWTPEEDTLLRKCIETYGEGKWHLVPLRAGLNRCRKSCRLRWLNYLKPNIKRGQFVKDEVDLIIRLHKLLGNRQVQYTVYCQCMPNVVIWSLIAGRLPGRTANDVKNFWNSQIEKKQHLLITPSRDQIGTPQEDNNNISQLKPITHANIARPRPRTFSNSPVQRPNSNNITLPNNLNYGQLPPSSSNQLTDDDDITKWWRNLLQTATGGGPQETSSVIAGLNDGNGDAAPQGQGGGGGSDLCMDMDICELLSFSDE